MANRGTKFVKVAAEDLLNFQVGERREERQKRVPRRSTGASEWSAPVRYVKGRFVQCNRVWVADTAKDATNAAWDPDYLVDWKEVLRVDLFVNKEIVCPICLDSVNVPKVTKCGHVYCWSCILKYFSLSEEVYRRCPVCAGQVCTAEMRTVRFVMSPEAAEVDFCLLGRDRQGAVPVIPGLPLADGARVPPHDAANARFCRVVRVGLDYARSQAVEEIADLAALRARSLADDTERLPHIAEARAVCEQVLLRHQPAGAEPPARDEGDADEAPTTYNVAAPPLELPDAAAVGEGQIVFYQAADGALVFWEPFSTKCLVHEVGGWTLLPRWLRVRVLRRTMFTVTEDARAKYRFLSHLPLGAEICLAEPDLHHLLSPHTKARFADELQRRADARKKEQKRRRREEKEIDRACASENESFRNTYVRVAEPQVLPTKADFVPLPRAGAAADAAPGPAADEPEAPAAEDGADGTGEEESPASSPGATSFAKVLRERIGSGASGGSQAEWRDLAAARRAEAGRRATLSAEEREELEAAEEKRKEDAAAIDAKMSSLLDAKLAVPSAEPEGEAGTSGKKKKKKPQAIRLFG